MSDSLIDCHTLLGVELEHSHQEVNSFLGSIGLEPLAKRLHFEVGNRVNHGLSHLGTQGLDVFLARFTSEGENSFKLVESGIAREKRFSQE